MATALNTPTLNSLRAKVLTGSPAWTLVYATQTNTPPASGACTAEAQTGTLFSIAGWQLGSAPTAQEVAQHLPQGNYGIHNVYYVEQWAQNGTVLGTGTIAYCCIAVYD
jgi:hypothetical protein